MDARCYYKKHDGMLRAVVDTIMKTLPRSASDNPSAGWLPTSHLIAVLPTF